MKTFKDNAGNTWTISINVNAVRRVLSLLKINLTAAGDGDEKGKALLAQLLTDPILLCDVVYCICKPEADKLGITDEDFGRAMGGDAIGNAQKALLEELVNFSPTPEMRRVAQKQIDRLTQMQTMALNHIEKQIDSPQMDKMMENALAGLSDLFGKFPVPSALTPENSRSES